MLDRCSSGSRPAMLDNELAVDGSSHRPDLDLQLVDRPRFPMTVRSAAPLRQLRGTPAGVTTVHVNEPELVDHLIELLQSSDCVVDRIGPRSVEIRSGWPVRDDAAGYELDGYLRVFEAMHPGARVMRDC